MSGPREKAKGLIALAADERTPKEERMTAAVQAVALIAKYKLLDGPLDGIGDVLRGEKATGAVRAASKLYEIFNDPDVTEMFKSARESIRERGSRTRRRRER